MFNMIARRNGSDFDLYANEEQFGRIANCESAYIVICTDPVLDRYVNAVIQPDFSMRERLSAIRQCYESFQHYLNDTICD